MAVNSRLSSFIRLFLSASFPKRVFDQNLSSENKIDLSGTYFHMNCFVWKLFWHRGKSHLRTGLFSNRLKGLARTVSKVVKSSKLFLMSYAYLCFGLNIFHFRFRRKSHANLLGLFLWRFFNNLPKIKFPEIDRHTVSFLTPTTFIYTRKK